MIIKIKNMISDIIIGISSISIIIYGVIWLGENMRGEEHEKGLIFLIITLVGLIAAFITESLKI